MSIIRSGGSRGASVLVAVAFVAIFGMVAMVAMNISPSQNRQELTALAYAGVNANGQATTPGGTPVAAANTTKEPDPIAKACAAAISQAKTAGTDTEQKQGQSVEDNCVSAIKTTDPAFAKTSGYKCVGKNAVVTMRLDGSTIINWTANPNMPPGQCKTLACTPNSALGVTGKCVTLSSAQGINKNAIATALAGPDTFDYSRSAAGVMRFSEIGIGSDTVSPTSNLSQENLNNLYALTGNQSGTVAIDSNQNITGVSYNQLISNLGGTDPSALAAQQSVTTQAVQLNSNINTGISGMNPDVTGSVPNGSSPNQYGAFTGKCTNGNTMNAMTGACDGGTADYSSKSTFAPAAPTPVTPPNNVPPPTAAPQQSGGFLNSLSNLFNPNPCRMVSTNPVIVQGNCAGTNGIGSPMGMNSTNGLFYQLGSMVGSLISGNNGYGGYGGIGAQQQMACATNQDQYQQQQQQYNQQIQQYNQQLQQQQYQQQQMQFQQQSYGYGGYPTAQPYGYGSSFPTNSSYGYGGMQPPPPQPPQPCYNNQQPQQCSYSPQQPDPSSCTSGTWTSTTSGNGCVSGWQCIPSGATNGTGGTGGGTGTGGTTNANTPAATISCQPKIADVGMTIAISYACANATQSSGGGFDTGGALSGSATTTISTPPQNTNTVTYTLTCNNQGATAGAQCSVQFGNPGGVFLANPSSVPLSGSTTLGWITSGMQSCVVSSPDLPSFTAQNASSTAANGVAIASGLTADTRFSLECTTAGGASMLATTTVTISQ